MRVEYTCPECENTGPVQPLEGGRPDDPTWVSPLMWEHAEVQTRCGNCAMTLYQDMGCMNLLQHEMPVAVGLVMVDEGRVLAVSRKDDPTAFGIPGGKVDPTDGDLAVPTRSATLRRACAREVREEVAVDLDPAKLVFVHQGVCPGGKDGVAYWMVAMTYADELPSSPKTRPGEGEVAWVFWKTLEDGPFGHYNRALHDTLNRYWLDDGSSR